MSTSGDHMKPMNEAPDATTLNARLLAAQLDKCLLECQRLKADLSEHNRGKSFPESIARHGPWLSMFLAVLGFGFGVWQFGDQQEKNRNAAIDQANRDRDTKDREFMKPLWERQLAVYFQAADAAAVIATATNSAIRAEAEQKFWSLYYGPLVIIETTNVAAAMKSFGSSLLGRDPAAGKTELQDRSLQLATQFQIALTNASSLRLIDFSMGKFLYKRSD
jgi:hypothetical protein